MLCCYKSAKISTLKTEKNLKTPKLLPVYNSNIKVTAKRVAPPHTGVQGPPPAKRHAYTTSAATIMSKMASIYIP